MLCRPAKSRLLIKISATRCVTVTLAPTAELPQDVSHAATTIGRQAGVDTNSTHRLVRMGILIDQLGQRTFFLKSMRCA